MRRCVLCVLFAVLFVACGLLSAVRCVFLCVVRCLMFAACFVHCGGRCVLSGWSLVLFDAVRCLVFVVFFVVNC